MAYTNSPLVVYTKLSPNHSGQRKHPINIITPHCVVGQASVESIGNCFMDTSRQASCNYGIGYDGKVMLCVEERNRSWCSSNRENDDRAITIECASDNFHPYAMKPAVYDSLVNLCVDICKRNGKNKILWLGDKSKTLNYKPKSNEMLITVHRWFAYKECPGDWLFSRLSQLAADVNKKLHTAPVKPPVEPKPVKPSTATLYRVRKSWDNPGSQLGAFKVLDNAKRLADKNPGYHVYDEAGTEVYPNSDTTDVPEAPTYTDTDTVIWMSLRSKELSEYAVAGIMGNLNAESAMKPNNLQDCYERKLGYNDASYTKAVDNGSYKNFVHDSAGYGLAQWTYWSRKQGLLSLAKRSNRSIADVTLQMDFLYEELQKFNLIDSLQNADSVKEASDIFLMQFERPAGVGPNSPASVAEQFKAVRAAMSQKYYDKFASSPVVPVEPKPQEKPDAEQSKLIKASAYAQNYKESASGRYRVTARGGLRIRDDAGCDKPILGVLPYNTEVLNYGYYTYLNGVSWMYVVASVGATKYIGFCSLEYLTRE